ncbi:MAG: hypothetical protein HPY73_05935 [Methanomassiliicoccales archaeon]|nr:MAG: hypothetical protein HPY73_05935 [Methanomassiliicoccales archaeon]
MRLTEVRTITRLTKGSRYRVVSKGDLNSSIVSEGDFQGFVQFGQDSGLCMLLDQRTGEEKMTRIIPSANVLYIDVIDAKEEEEVKRKDVPLVSYG